MGRDHKEHKRHRSRSKERKRSRSRSPRDRRDRDRDSRRDRERQRDYDRRGDDKMRDREKQRDADNKQRQQETKKESKSAVFEMEESRNDIDDILGMKDVDLEKEMERRRRNVELWRAKKKKDELDQASEASDDKNRKKKAWNLDDEDDEDEFDVLSQEKSEKSTENGQNIEKIDKKPVKMEEEDEEEDPLDAFMAEISKKNAKKSGNSGQKSSGVVTIIQEEKPEKEKGQLLENEDNMDMVIDDFDIETAAASLCHKGRMLAATDHSKVYYRKFKKNFYIETEEIKRMSKAEVKAYRDELDSITVKGIDVPKPIKTWAQCGVNLKMMNVLKKYEYTKPTSIQAQAIPSIMSGRDVIGIAKTGSGKTLAFLLPMFRHILDQPELEEGDGPIAVILAPTRELAMQTYKEANKFAKVLGLRVACTYGGVGISEQIADLKRGAEIVVCTPGRMIDVLAANSGKVTNLRRVTYLVLDEADRMFDKGFEPQVRSLLTVSYGFREKVEEKKVFSRKIKKSG
ncbi:hypothetical protein CRE_13197 [Caenorhabditis remanei]|uniref:RNA helicase n=1 Tax=Caenorhabditis remanei TaxID=31234 RepID=E3NQ47_CAERE|nr:hypothetical protein CRE_13197 [Caenorhabditis remanei]